jgi:hypothetical protein
VAGGAVHLELLSQLLPCGGVSDIGGSVAESRRGGAPAAGHASGDVTLGSLASVGHGALASLVQLMN